MVRADKGSASGGPRIFLASSRLGEDLGLHRTIDQMEKISRQIVFQTTADTHRRKRLNKKVLGTI